MTYLAEKLATGVAEMGLQVSEATQERLLAYLFLLEKWNKVYNLTAVRDLDEMVVLHFLDSLSVLPYIKAKQLLDVGSGAGLPGIVLAICLPELQVTTIDSVQKKATFMRQVKGELGLENLAVVNQRVEDYQPAETFEVIISRAFAEVALFIELTQHLLSDRGVWLAMKGVSPQQELDDMAMVEGVIHPLSVAGLKAERHLAVIKRTVN